MKVSTSDSQQTQAFSIDHENVLPEHYRLIELIGRGGMAEVYLAEDRRLGRKVAIKFLSQEFRRDPDRVRRFRQEARSASALNHPNILIIHDIGDRSGVQFIVSEYVEGETLGTRIAQGRVPFAEAVDIAIQVASALSAAHNAGIVHRDIKPDNIMIRNDGAVKVLDFGLAKARGFTTSNGSALDAMTLDSGSTSPGLIVGTPQYMSPEQARGKELDGRTDIFSLGIIIFEMITRHSPFAGGSFADTMAAVLTKEPRRMEEFVENAPARLIGLVDKCLRKERDERFASMAELETELKLLRTEVISTPKDTAEVDPAKSHRTEIRPTHQHSIRRFVSNTFEHRPPWAVPIILLAAALLVGGWWAWDRIPALSSQPPLMRTVPITSWSSSVGDFAPAASFSHDERWIAFTAKRDEGSDIWAKPTSGGDAIQVTKNGFYNQYPVWSPSGDEIAFFARNGQRRGLWRTKFTGGDHREIATNLDSSARVQLWGKSGTIYLQSKGELFAADASTGDITKVTDFGSAGLKPRTIEISPDEKKVAYSIRDGSEWRIYIRRLDSLSAELVGTSSEQIDYLAWHPSSDTVYCSLSVNGVLQVFVAKLGGSEPKQLTNGPLDFFIHDVSSAGRILYGSVSESSDLWQVETENGRETVVANDVASEYWPDCGPDGRVVFQSVTQTEKPTKGAIRIASPGLPNEMSLVSADGFAPVWSPRGDSIAFLRRVDGGIGMWRATPSGEGASRMTDAGVLSPDYMVMPYIKFDAHSFTWSPDGTSIAYAASIEETTNIWLASVTATEEKRQVTWNKNRLESLCCPFWKLDGKSIIFTSVLSSEDPVRKTRFRIWEVPADGSEPRIALETDWRFRLLGLSASGDELIYAKSFDRSDPGPVVHSMEVFSFSLTTGKETIIDRISDVYFQNTHLSKDSGSLVYVTRKDNFTKVLTFHIKTGSRKEVLSLTDPKLLISAISWSHDGKSLVYGKQTRTSLLSMLTD